MSSVFHTTVMSLVFVYLFFLKIEDNGACQKLLRPVLRIRMLLKLLDS